MLTHVRRVTPHERRRAFALASGQNVRPLVSHHGWRVGLRGTEGMPREVHFTHTELASGQHAISSPGIEGSCVVGAPGESALDVEKQAIEALMSPRQLDAGSSSSIAAIEFTAA